MVIDNHFYSTILPVLSGISTWAILHRYPIAGDHAAGLYFSSSIAIFLALKLTQSDVSWFTAVCYTFKRIILFTFAALSTTALYRLSPFHPLASFPGPWYYRFSSLWLSWISFFGRRHFILHELHKKYGPFLRIGPDTLSINTFSANAVYIAASGSAKSDAYLAPGRAMKGVGLFFKHPKLTREIHAERRRVWTPAFTNASWTNALPIIDRRTWDLIASFDRRKDAGTGLVNLSDAFAHWSYDFMGEITFGGSNELELLQNGDPQRLVAIGKAATVILDSVGQSPWLIDILWLLPFGGSMHALKNACEAMMLKRLNADSDVQIRDLASYLIAPHPKTGERIPVDDLYNDAIIAVQGGSDNTSTALIVIFYFLMVYPKYFDALRKEVDAAFPNPTAVLDPAKLTDLPFLNSVINETLRLSTPYFLPRVLPKEGITIDGRFVPGETIVGVPYYSQHLSSENFYPDPEDFRPERWLTEGLGPETITNRAALNSFSSGPHNCLARNWAYHEMRYVTARMVLVCDFGLPEKFEVRKFRDGILNMRTTVLTRVLYGKVTRRPGLNLAGTL